MDYKKNSKGFGCGSNMNRTSLHLVNKGLKGGGQGFGVAYQSISAGKFSPTKNGGKRSSKSKM